jgi:succinate-acetate transporter protein
MSSQAPLDEPDEPGEPGAPAARAALGAAGLPVRVTLRPLGSPLTVGMSGLAIASFVESGLDLAWISKAQIHEAGLILIAIPFLLQGIACVFAYLARDGAAGATLGVLSTTWLAYGLIQLNSAPGSRSGAAGLLLLVAGAMIALSASAIALYKPLPAAVFGLASVRFLVTGIYLLSGSPAWHDAGGIIGLVVCGLAAYGVLAFELEDQRHRAVIPTFRRGPARAADLGDLGDPVAAVRGLSTEAGIRRST